MFSHNGYGPGPMSIMAERMCSKGNQGAINKQSIDIIQQVILLITCRIYIIFPIKCKHVKNIKLTIHKCVLIAMTVPNPTQHTQIDMFHCIYKKLNRISRIFSNQGMIRSETIPESTQAEDCGSMPCTSSLHDVQVESLCLEVRISMP